MLWTAGHTYFRLVRDSTVIGVADSAGSRATVASSSQQQSNWGVTDHVTSCLDSPNTSSQITYKVGVNQGAGASANWYTNRSGSDTDTGDYERGISLISATEIAV